jgi:hypothetical protein
MSPVVSSCTVEALPTTTAGLRAGGAGDVAKWPKAMVCKTIIRRFKSARRLQLTPLFGGLLLAACGDPPDPPAATESRSSARFVLWRSDADPVDRPVAVFVDAPGGRADRLAANSDVTTFLNDRFHPLFHETDEQQPSGTVQFLTSDGCAFAPAFAPRDSAALIAAANGVVLRPEAVGRHAPTFTRACPAGRGID